MNDSTFQRPIDWKSYARTDVGLVREANEDSYIERPERGLWAIADGMGGHRFGDVASQMIVDALDSIDPESCLSDYVDTIEDSVLQVNRELLRLASESSENGTMGTTLVALILKNRVGVCLWVGDSQLYRFRNQQLVQLSRDHSQVEEMIEMGLLSAEEADSHPERNVITRAIGVEDGLCLDFNVFSTRVGDTYLLCSDGLYSVVSTDSIIQSLDHRDLEKSTDALIKQCLNEGAPDNISVIVVRGNPGKIQPSSME